MKEFVVAYYCIINLIEFIMMKLDKNRAIHHQYRIPEKRLFFLALLGGGLGGWLGMYLWHHKTKHWYFVIGMPLFFLINLACLFVIWRNMIL